MSLTCSPVCAQQTAPVAPPSTAATTSSVSAPRADSQQVNAVVHRLNGIKVLDMLRRKGAKVSLLDDELMIADDAHTSITAGFSLEDGSVVARLPQAEMEISAPLMTFYGVTANAPKAANAPQPPSNLFIVQRDGKQLPATLVGIDGGTGLSLLQVTGLQSVLSRDAKEETLVLGQRIRLLAPARAQQAEGLASDSLFLGVSELEGILTDIARTSAGKLTRLTVRAEKLSPAIVGGIALNEAGETIGMVDSSGEVEAHLIPVAAVRRAVNRIRLSLKSKPQPWLGVRGEAVAGTSLDQLMSVGWKHDEAFKLMSQRLGVVLTAVPPDTPAWFANLRSGDVVMQVNAGQVKSAENFSSLLKEAGGGVPVRFTVLRPNRPAPRVVTVKLSESVNPVLEMEAVEARASRQQSADPLVARGIETIGLTPKLAAHMKARGGLLIVPVYPQSAAARAGLRAGDVIEAIDGKLLTESNLTGALPPQVSLSIIRDGHPLEVKLAVSNVKQR